MGWLQSSWWRHQMKTFSALLALCAGNSSVTDEFPAQRTVTRSFEVFFDLRLYKRLNKQSWGWWFERQSRPLWRQGNGHRNERTKGKDYWSHFSSFFSISILICYSEAYRSYRGQRFTFAQSNSAILVNTFGLSKWHARGGQILRNNLIYYMWLHIMKSVSLKQITYIAKFHHFYTLIINVVIYIFIYIYTCIYVCVCVLHATIIQLFNSYKAFLQFVQNNPEWLTLFGRQENHYLHM